MTFSFAGTAVTPQPDGIVSARWVLTLSLAILSQKSCQGKCAVKLSSFSHPPVSPLHHGAPVFRSISGHTILCSPKTLPFLFFFFSFFMFLLLTLIIAVLHLQHNLALRAYRPALLRLRDSLSKALQMLLMCTYPAEQACPQLSAILSASATVICQL